MGGVRWTETFRGWLAFGERDFNQATLPEHREATTARLSVRIPDLGPFLAEQADGGVLTPPARAADVTDGSIDCDALFGGPLRVIGGLFRAFVTATDLEPRDALHQRMRYVLELAGPGGDSYRLEGFKLIENDPGYDSWSDATTLFVRIHRAGATDALASGILRIGPLAFLRELASFRGTGGPLPRRIAAVARYQRFFAANLARAYAGGPVSGSRPAFPQDRPDPAWLKAPDGDARGASASAARGAPTPAPAYEPVCGTRLARAVIPFRVPDLDFPLNLHRLRTLDDDGQIRAPDPARGPVLLVPGSGVRAEMYYGQPGGGSLGEYLLGLGYDVWVETWRASIDLPPNPYTLDQAAVHDHPTAVRTILAVCDAEAAAAAAAPAPAPAPAAAAAAADAEAEVTGGHDPVTLKAVIHCQGSISFMMAAVAGLIDERVTHIISSAVSLFIDVTASTWLKQRLAMPVVKRLFPGLDAQWGIRPITPSAGAFAAAAKRMERPCGNPSCQVANFMYGSGWDVLFRHVDDRGDPWVAPAVHEWAGRELGYTPLTLIGQVAESSRHGYVVPAPPAAPGATPLPGAPAGYLTQTPRTGAQITFIAGDHNNMFRWQGQRRARDFLDQAAGPGRADFVALPGFGHLDTFWAIRAPEIVYPVIRDGLDWRHGDPPPSAGPDRPTRGGALPPRRGRLLSRRR
jgi:hypothetical protein